MTGERETPWGTEPRALLNFHVQVRARQSGVPRRNIRVVGNAATRIPDFDKTQVGSEAYNRDGLWVRCSPGDIDAPSNRTLVSTTL